MSEVVRTEQGEGVVGLPSVAVTIVTYNSAKYIGRCLQSVFEQDYPDLQVVVVDNASADASNTEVLRFRSDRLQLIASETNTGFAGGQNRAIAASESDWVLTLNPDVRMSRDFIWRLVKAGRQDPRIGTVCGKLLGMGEEFVVPEQPVFDSTGIYMTPNLRHFDRGSRVRDTGQFEREEFVFGATGAAALYRRKMIEDVSIEGEFFDEDFFAYREDADVAWRVQLFGWTCLYTPAAIAYHVRSVVPENRGQVSAFINRHSVKNRFLLRIKNATASLYRRFWLPMTLRDLVVVGGCLLREWSSLPAFVQVAALFPKMWRKRRAIQSRRRVSDEYINQWFCSEPIGLPAAFRASGEVLTR